MTSEQDKQEARSSLDQGVAMCEKEHPPDAVLDCTLNAKTVADLEACDKLRVR